MKWWCRRTNNNAAVWIAVMAVLISTNGAHPVHHDRWWLVGVAAGIIVSVTALLLGARLRGRRCP